MFQETCLATGYRSYTLTTVPDCCGDVNSSSGAFPRLPVKANSGCAFLVVSPRAFRDAVPSDVRVDGTRPLIMGG